MRAGWTFPLAVAASALAAAACSDDECSAGDDHCDGNVAWVCNGGGDKGPLAWESQDCAAEDAVCRNGACFAEPLVPCETPDQWTCDEQKLHAGRCSERGYWGWDLRRTCDPAGGETCATGVRTWEEGSQVLALCVLDPREPCEAGEVRTCRDRRVVACSEIGLRAQVQDCAAEGLACADGTCVLPAR